MRELVGSVILRSKTDPAVFRAACLLCTWATDVRGTSEAVAQTAATAHVEATHGGNFVRTIGPPS